MHKIIRKIIFVSGLVTIVVAVLFLSLLLITGRKSNQIVETPDEKIRSEFDQNLIFGKEDKTTEFASKNGDTISFTKLTGERYEARNSTFEVRVNNTKIGQFSGVSRSIPSFSIDSKMFVFRLLTGCGASCFNTYIEVVDLINPKILNISTPRKYQDYKIEKSRSGIEIEPFIESYTWFGSDKLKIMFYFIAFDNNMGAKYYRVSPKEVWQYNLITGQYTLLETVPE